eukprot:SAG11_NODE_39316_length_235_cov_8.235294_1_plen_52_part_01
MEYLCILLCDINADMKNLVQYPGTLHASLNYTKFSNKCSIVERRQLRHLHVD